MDRKRRAGFTGIGVAGFNHVNVRDTERSQPAQEMAVESDRVRITDVVECTERRQPHADAISAPDLHQRGHHFHQ